MGPRPEVARAPRLFHPGPLSEGAVIALTEGGSRHIQALRLGNGDVVSLFCGDGAEWSAEIVAIERRGASARLLERSETDRESPLRVTLAQSIAAGDRMDWIIQKATELGMHALQPLMTERAVIRLSLERRERREQHWQNVAIAACEQCGRNRIPAVLPSVRLEEFATSPQADTLRLLLSPAASRRIADLPQCAAAVLAVGPEGGFSPQESALLQQRGFAPVRLGPRILRTETAPLAALAVLQSLAGDF